MKKYIFLMAAGMLAFCSCMQIDQETADNKFQGVQSITIPLETEDVDRTDETKAYLNQQDETTWNYVWEDGDQMGFFQFRNGYVYLQSRAEVDKRPDGCEVIYCSDGFQTRDAIYSYLYQPVAEGQLAARGISNTNPRNLYIRIPDSQMTSTTPEQYSYTEDHSFSLLPNTSNLPTLILSGSEYDSIEGYTVPSKQISFKVKGYDRNLTYRCTGASNLVIDYYGNATVDLDFNPVTESDKINSTVNALTLISTFKQVYNISIYAEGYESKPATITVTADISHQTGIAHWGLITPQAEITYTVSGSSADIVSNVLVSGASKPYPVRDCMPCVSKGLTLTSGMIDYPSEIQSHMTMYMLGSVAEFRLYSLDKSIAAGENLIGVIFEASDNCAGDCKYDLTSETLKISGMTTNKIMSLDTNGKILKYGKENYSSLYMVLAPGTYSADVHFITLDHVYTFHMGAKTFTRAVKKAINCNLASSSCEVVSYGEFFNGSEDGKTESDDM